MAHSITSTASSGTHHTTTRITQPNRLRLIRLTWAVIVLLGVGWGLTNLWVYTDQRLTRCEALPCSSYIQLDPAVATSYEQNGVPFAVVALIRPILELTTALLYLSVGLVIFRRRPDDWIGLLTSLMLCLLGFRLTGVSATLPQIMPSALPLGVFLMSVMFIATYATLFLIPSGRFFPRWGVIPFVIIVIYDVARGIMTYLPVNFGINLYVMQLGSLVLSGVGLYCQVQRYRQLSPIERQQLKWVLLAVGLLLSGLLTSILSNLIVPSLDGTAFVVISLLSLVVQYVLYMGLPLAFAFSMLRYRLWDADIVINRTLGYVGSTLTLALVFFTLFFALRAALSGLLGGDSTLPLVIATAVVAALFNPVRARLAGFVDKQIYGFRVELRDIRKRAAHETHFVTLKHVTQGQHSGKQIGGYRLIGVLGKGGMGEVYAAEPLDGTPPVAVKILPPELAAQTEPLARFEREAEFLTRLQHPNIVRTMGAGMADGLHYLVMELIDGQTLSERMKHGSPLSQGAAVALIRDVAVALDAAHAAGIIHRDVKPSNILLRPTPEGIEAVLTDFGIAKLAQDATSSLTQSNLLGTLDYIAPEQIIASRGVDHRADIYALGVIAYHLLVGSHPFGGAPAALLFAHLNQPPPDPRDSRPDFPRHHVQALLKALAKKPEERYESASDFARALEI